MNNINDKDIIEVLNIPYDSEDEFCDSDDEFLNIFPRDFNEVHIFIFYSK